MTFSTLNWDLSFNAVGKKNKFLIKMDTQKEIKMAEQFTFQFFLNSMFNILSYYNGIYPI